MTEAEYKSEFEHTKYTPYLALTGKLWGVFCEDFGGKWAHYNGTALYIYLSSLKNQHNEVWPDNDKMPDSINQTFLECVRVRTFGRYGLQQIQVDTYYLQMYLWRFVSDEKWVDLPSNL